MKLIAVVDTETTGLNPYRHDRIVEIAIVLVHPHDGIVAEVETLVNPERDVGPTSIHGLTATDVIGAPRFADVAGRFVEAFRTAATVAGHNLRFDLSFLHSEFARIGIEIPDCPTLDTMALAGGGTLSTCCSRAGVCFDGRPHGALVDARATAKLLLQILSQSPDLRRECEQCRPPPWPTVAVGAGALMPRAARQQSHNAVPGYVQRLAASLSASASAAVSSEAEKDYRGLLWSVLEDGRVDQEEGNALVEVASRWGLSFQLVQGIHLECLTRLARQAWADRHMTEAERAEIQLAARLLGFGSMPETKLQELLRSTEAGTSAVEGVADATNWRGKTVCFTGECACSIGGKLLTRADAERLAGEKGLRPVGSVTRQLDVLVVADPNTQSGKARKARDYGVRVVHELHFWRMLGVAVD